MQYIFTHKFFTQEERKISEPVNMKNIVAEEVYNEFGRT